MFYYDCLNRHPFFNTSPDPGPDPDPESRFTLNPDPDPDPGIESQSRWGLHRGPFGPPPSGPMFRGPGSRHPLHPGCKKI